MKVKLRDYKGDFPADSEYADALKRLGEGVLSPVSDVSAPPAGIADTVDRLDSLLGETPTRLAIAQLESNPAAQTWVEQGMSLHEGEDTCLFCAGAVTDTRREELARHFDESWLDIRGRAASLLQQVETYRTELGTWLSSLPETAALASELRSTYASQVKALTEEVRARLTTLDKVVEVGRAKQADPSSTPRLPDVAALKKSLTTAALVGAVKEHNAQAAAQGERTERLYTIVLDHLIGSRSAPFRQIAGKLDEAETQYADARKALKLARKTLEELKQKQLTSHKMAETLTTLSVNLG